MTALNVSAIVFTALLPRIAPTQTRRRSVLAEAKQGLKYTLGHKTILLVLLFFIISILLAMPYMMMMPVFAKDILRVGPSGQGILMSMSGIGALAASLTLASLPSKRRGITLLMSNVLMGVALIVFAFSVSWPLSLGMMLLVGMGRIGNNTAGSALLQSHTDPEYLGRVMSIMMMSFGFSQVGTFFAGILAEGISAQWAIGGFAAALVLTSVGALLFVPKLRNLD
jgi:MFS family permease